MSVQTVTMEPIKSTGPLPKLQVPLSASEVSPTNGQSNATNNAKTTTPPSSTPGSARAQQQPVIQISRKIRACTECKGHKIKCDMPPAASKCVRCQRLKLECVVNKSLQTLLDDESQWKTMMQQRADGLQSAVAALLEKLDMPNLDNFVPRSPAMGSNNGQAPARNQSPHYDSNNGASPRAEIGRRGEVIGMAMTRENSLEPEQQKEAEETLVPMANLYEVTKLRNLRSYQSGRRPLTGDMLMREDFITRGLISLDEAKDLFQLFYTSPNQFLWGGIALKHQNLTSVRRSSPLLTAAILTVAALHMPGNANIFDVCYAEFTRLVCDSVLDRFHSLDEVRALTIGAFYLSDVSWKLSGLAVRLATELNLHHAFHKAIRGSAADFEKVQLWYLLYVCDHHFSIAYGRPPSIPEDPSISNHLQFLKLPLATQVDVRLHSQVALFAVLTRIYHVFGSDPEREITEADMDQLREFNSELDNWHRDWQPRLAENTFYIGEYPEKGVILHYHFAKLQLNSLVFRGINRHPLTTDRREFAATAISSAVTTMTVVLDEPAIYKALVGVPLYIHAMLAFSAVFLLKASSRWKQSVGISVVDANEVTASTERIIELLGNAVASERHLTFHIARGLQKRLEMQMHLLQKTESTAETNGQKGPRKKTRNQISGTHSSNVNEKIQTQPQQHLQYHLQPQHQLQSQPLQHHSQQQQIELLAQGGFPSKMNGSFGGPVSNGGRDLFNRLLDAQNTTQYPQPGMGFDPYSNNINNMAPSGPGHHPFVESFDLDALHFPEGVFDYVFSQMPE
jgi:hypothetical protein